MSINSNEFYENFYVSYLISVLSKEFITQLSRGEGIRHADVQLRSKTANICFTRITILGIISVGKIWKLLTKGSDDASSTDGVDIRWLDTSIKEEIGKCTIEQVLCFQNTYDESEHLSMYLNANGKSLPSVKLLQKYMTRANEVKKIICGVLGTSRDAIVGSAAEGLATTDSDVDVIKIGHTFEVFDCIREPFNMVAGHCQSIRQSEKRHPGYSKLSVISLDCRFFEDDVSKYTFTGKKDGKVYLKNNVKEIINGPDSTKHYSIHGPAFNHVIYPQKPNSHQDDFYIFQRNERMSADVVFCIGSNQWPDEAYEWITRIRASDWPTRKLVDHIIKTGYLLAGVGNKASHESELQWRISFNEAEQLMIESFNETQIHCIFLLKLMKNISLSNIAGKNITSYSMKTVMFWCLEKKQDTFWQYSNLVVCFCFCVTKLKSFVKRGFLPNYFIRNRNQFVAKEFTSDIQTRTLKYLEGFLKDPKAGLRLILPLYRKSEDCQMPIMHYSSQLNFILRWLKLMITDEYIYPFELLLELYDGCNIHYISKRCNESLNKLMNVGYTQPLIKRLQNYLGVLQYILIKEEKQKGKDSADSNARKKYSEYMKLSASGDLTHNTLRIATCYLDDGVKEKCLNMIRTVTDLGEDFFVRTAADRLKESIQRSYEELNNHKTVHDIEPVIDIINNIDSIYKDPYRTTEKFEELKANGQLLIGYDVLINAWKRYYFDVTFMLAELPVLPEPAAVELLIDKKQTSVTFHPFLYGLLLEYLWHKKYGPENKGKELVLERMENYVSIASNIPDKQKAIGFNFLAFCYSLQKENQAAERYRYIDLILEEK
ncbi:Hypothetical predicted protein [Mytilus galloprovincialis]|uniref:Mab-21-like HhH/H2TH-like domain-containing protein n=1 Tax=Mytilus galloprovincialis TaxID=29158 RepID=A0A8B6D186_MYTGA|nr:Hypothetical predicted protein [Mytilus galloprovincialis]